MKVTARGKHEADLSAEEAKGQEEARVPEAQCERERQEDPRPEACEGQEAPDESVGVGVVSHELGRDRRIEGGRALKAALREGKVVRSPYFKLRYLTGEGPPGVAFLAGRRVGGAVKRNRAKRVLREAFRTSDADVSGLETLVFIATERTGAVPFTELKSAVVAALRDASDRAG
jgi:ribonuclease P protein component